MAGDPGGTRIGSTLIGGYGYTYRSYFDFLPSDNTRLTYTDSGVWGTTQPVLRSPVDLPFGAVLRDVEFYVSGTGQVILSVDLWRSTYGTPFNLYTMAHPGSAGGAMRAIRISVIDEWNGPYAAGSRLVLGINNSSPTVQLNGARVGYSRTPTGVVMLDKPVRAYDSRKGAKIGNGQTRIHSLASYLPSGATSAIVHLTATNGEKTGGLAVYNAGTTVPSGSALYWTSTTRSIQVHSGVTSAKQLKVTMRGVSGSKCHYFFDVVGYTA